MKKQFLAMVLCIAVSVSAICMMPLPAMAANVVTIGNFGSNTVLTYAQYDALRTGNISAVQIGCVWYYQFSKGGTVLRVRPEAFSQTVGNNYTKLNKALTSGLMSTSGIPNVSGYVFKSRTGTSRRNVMSSAVSPKKTVMTQLNMYTTYFSYLKVTANRVGSEIDLECTKCGHIQFTYYDKVQSFVWGKNGYHTPQNAKEYLSALSRTVSNSVKTSMTPAFTLTVNKPGTNCVCLNSMLHRGKGIADTKTDVSEYVELALNVGKLLSSTSPVSAMENLFKIYKQGAKMQPNSSEYTSNKKLYLSFTKGGKTYSCLKAEFTSPIKLKKCDDYYRAEVRLNKQPSVTGTKTTMSVSFSVKVN